mmetsp:Transcript_31962/g.67030  ORF Transcript_31962/g.67030 Transcript_31962/m.67030 type:complete len:212 (+) Transcript_31962:227-862(+)
MEQRTTAAICPPTSSRVCGERTGREGASSTSPRDAPTTPRAGPPRRCADTDATTPNSTTGNAGGAPTRTTSSTGCSRRWTCIAWRSGATTTALPAPAAEGERPTTRRRRRRPRRRTGRPGSCWGRTGPCGGRTCRRACTTRSSRRTRGCRPPRPSTRITTLRPFRVRRRRCARRRWGWAGRTSRDFWMGGWITRCPTSWRTCSTSSRQRGS